MGITLVFRKTGREIKTAVQKRRQQLQERLSARNTVLDEFLSNPRKVRSYVVRMAGQPVFHSGRSNQGYSLYSKDEISSEEMQEVSQLCQRISEIEQELHRLSLIAIHLDDEQVFELTFNDLIGYGFDTSLERDIEVDY